jgi:hypothetical protein
MVSVSPDVDREGAALVLNQRGTRNDRLSGSIQTAHTAAG